MAEGLPGSSIADALHRAVDELVTAASAERVDISGDQPPHGRRAEG